MCVCVCARARALAIMIVFNSIIHIHKLYTNILNMRFRSNTTQPLNHVKKLC